MFEVAPEDVSDFAVDWEPIEVPGDITSAIQGACSSTLPSGPGRASQAPTVPVPRSELADTFLLNLYREKRESLRQLEEQLWEAGLAIDGEDAETDAA